MVLVPPLYTKERNVGCGLERNVRTSRHLVSSFFFFLKRHVRRVSPLEEKELALIPWYKPAEMEMRSLTATGGWKENVPRWHSSPALLPPFTTLTNYNDDLFPSVRTEDNSP